MVLHAAARLRHGLLPTTVGLLVALAGPPALVIAADYVFGRSRGIGLQVVLQMIFCAMVGVVVWVVIRWERLDLSSIGWKRPDWITLASGLLLAAFLVYVMPLVTRPLMSALQLGGFEAGVSRLELLPGWFRLLLALTGGVAEEVLYRGYAVERLETITRSCWAGAVLAAVAFGLAHIPSWGAGPALGADLPFGIAMTLFYLWRRDLLANCLAHCVALLVGLLSIS